MKKETTITLIKIFAVFVVFIFSILMMNTIRQYFSFKTDVGFLQFKQEVVNNQYWIFFFYVHIFSIILCLLAGLTQFSSQILRENRKLHRILGKIYVYNILLINVPACFVLAVFSNGGLLGITGFVVQNCLWAITTVMAVIFVKKRNIEKHKKFMIFSYAITTTAITFRIIKNLIYNEQYFSYTLFYGLNVWISLFLNLGIAFYIVKSKIIIFQK